MGAEQSSVPGGGTESFHVLRVQENSPGAKAGLEAYFDFIVAVEGTRLNKDDSTLRNMLQSNENKPLKMTVYNSKRNDSRVVELTPTSLWGGNGLLGVSIRFCSFQGANENVWHVLEVMPGSPAAIAGLQSDVDFIIGSEVMLSDGDDFFALVESHDGKPLKLFVYNTVTDGCREIEITPNSNWGGEGALGCGIGYGYLHRIPSATDIPRATGSEAFTVTTETPPHQPAARVAPSADGFSDVPLGVPSPVQHTAPTTVGVEPAMAALDLSEPSSLSRDTMGPSPTIQLVAPTVSVGSTPAYASQNFQLAGQPAPVSVAAPLVPVNATAPTGIVPPVVVPGSSTAPVVPVGAAAPMVSVGAAAPIVPVGAAASAIPVGTAAPIVPIGAAAPMVPVVAAAPFSQVSAAAPIAPVGGSAPIAPVGVTPPSVPLVQPVISLPSFSAANPSSYTMPPAVANAPLGQPDMANVTASSASPSTQPPDV